MKCLKCGKEFDTYCPYCGTNTEKKIKEAKKKKETSKVYGDPCYDVKW